MSLIGVNLMKFEGNAAKTINDKYLSNDLDLNITIKHHNHYIV